MSSDLFEKFRLFRGRGGGDGSRTPTDPDRSRVKRVLFGPPDHEANRRFVEQELAKGQREMSERYNFDFINGQPLEGRYQWERFSVPTPPSTSSSNVDKENVASLSERDNLKENSSLVNVANPASQVVTPAPAPVTAVTATTVTSSASSSSTNSTCDIPRNSCSRATSSSASTSSQKSTASRHSSRKITGHFQQRKRSKSNVKTQERKTETERDLSPPPLPTPTQPPLSAETANN